MAYRLESLSSYNRLSLEELIDTIEFDPIIDFTNALGLNAFEFSPAATFMTSSSPSFSPMPISSTPFGSGILPDGYRYVGDDIMNNLYGEGSGYDLHDDANFNFGTALTFASIPGLTAPVSNLFASSISVSTNGNSDLDQYIVQVTNLAQAALDNIAQYIEAATGASLDIAITLAQQGASTVASAGSNGLYFSGQTINGLSEVVTNSQIEFMTGNDPNGAAADIFITVNTDFLTSAQAFLETGANRTPGSNQIDYVSVLTHEIMHGLGFFSFRDNSGQASNPNNPPNIESTYGTNVSFGTEFDSLIPRYTSDNIVDVYGESVILESLFNSAGSDVSHFGRFTPDFDTTDLRFALMNPSVVNGDVTTFGAVELAVLEDLGYAIVNDAGVELVNQVVGRNEGLVISLEAGDLTTGGMTGLTISQSATSLNNSTASVGVEITLSDGTTQISRARLTNDESDIFYAFDLDVLETYGDLGGGNFDVRFFYAGNAELENGTLEQTYVRNLDLVNGTGGDDRYTDVFGDNRYSGGDGEDFVVGRAGNDLIFGGAGIDTIFGGEDDDQIFGGADNDIIRGESGEDAIYGGSGDDKLRGLTDDDYISGGLDNDTIFGGSGNDTIDGDAGADTLYGEAGEDVLNGGDGVDLIYGGADDDRASGGAGDDQIRGQSGNDSLDGEAGNDRIIGGDGTDIINGGTGEDVLFGNNDADLLNGGNGNDRIYGDQGDDILNGDAGDDLMFGGAGDDTMNGGDDIDRLYGGDDSDTLNGDAGNDRLFGGTGDDNLNGGIGDDRIVGQDGTDILNGGQGNDFLIGGNGNDEMNGGDDNDKLFGGNDSDILNGNEGDDRLFGDAGSDYLNGGAGQDALFGGEGVDTFVMARRNGQDVIKDFEDGIDNLFAEGFSAAEVQTAIDGATYTSRYMLIDFGNGDTLQIENVVEGDITIDDFI